MQDFVELVKTSRSIRRFDNAVPVTEAQLTNLIEAARYAPTGANKQPLRFFPILAKEDCDQLFACLHWAMALPDWKGPQESERPAGYIVILADTDVVPEQRVSVDVGIAAQTMALAGASQGLGVCMLGAFKKEDVTHCLKLPDNLIPELILAVGKKAEQVCIVDAAPGSDLRYYRDENSVHYVPKRKLDELIYKG